MLERPDDGFLQTLLDTIEATDIFPFDVRGLNGHRAHTRGLHGTERLFKVLHAGLKPAKETGGKRPTPLIDLRHDLLDRQNAGLLAEAGKVRADKAVRHLGQFVQVDIFPKRHVVGMHFEDFEARLSVWDGNEDLSVKTAGPAERTLDGIGQIGRTKDNNLAALIEAVHESKQLGDEALLTPLGLFTVGRNRVQLIEIDNARGIRGGGLEDFAEIGLTLTIVRAHQLGAIDDLEMGIGLLRDGLGDQGLPASRRPVEQDPLGGIDPQFLEHLGITQW